jgi:hypothetical protein
VSDQTNDGLPGIDYRSEGVTDSEKYLKRLCEHTFLRLWSYPGIYRDQSSGGGAKNGKEVCDLLVVFDQHIIIFSDKKCEFPNTGDLDLDWSRWVKRAVLKSADQLYGAERWIKAFPNRLFLDSGCSQPLLIPLPNVTTAKFHRILVAHGASKRCKKELGGSGSLMIHTDVIGDMHLRKEEGGYPFVIGQIDPQKGYIHVLDDFTVDILLKTLDTISDFVSYIEKKETLILSGLLLAIAGEEDLLAVYLRKLNKQEEHDFIFDEEYNAIAIDEGFWEDFLKSPQYRYQREANRVSYAWDDLIEQFSTHAMQGTQYLPNPYGILGTEKTMRFLARENRTRRRMLARSLFEIMAKNPKTMKTARIIKPSRLGDPYYVFLLLPPLEGITEEEYRIGRYKFLEAHCLVTKLIFPDALDIVGLATESGTDIYRSEDAMYLDAREWNDDMQAEALSLQEDLGILTNLTMYAGTEYEFPIPSKSTRRRQQRKHRHK